MKEPIAIIGGGIAGLSLSIDLRRRGHAVTVLEKGHYPRHKVCGEYISMESHRYLMDICPSLSTLSLPKITQFKLTAPGGNQFTTALGLGGFGISRYKLEEMLFNEALKQGVVCMTGTKVQEVLPDADSNGYRIQTSQGFVTASFVCNSSGRQSNVSQRTVLPDKSDTNYIGVKYHVKLKRDAGQIEIHNFPGGYCGISAIEEDKACLCYIVNSQKLHLAGNAIPELERRFLFQNAHLKNLLTNAEFVFKEPVTVSGIHFRIHAPETADAFYLGDSAGSIAPITGNGMSMGLRSASVLASHMDRYFAQTITLDQLHVSYAHFWTDNFAFRIKRSRHLQKLAESPFLTRCLINMFNICPPMARGIIKQTHGNPF